MRWARADGRLRDDPMLGVSGYNAAEDVRHARRALSEAEMAELVATAADGPEAYGMAGTDRAMAYRLAAGTGFRANELRSLTPESFRLDDARPFVALRPEDAKNGRMADQPIAPALAADVGRHIGVAAGPPGPAAAPPHGGHDPGRPGGGGDRLRDGRGVRRLPQPAGVLHHGVDPVGGVGQDDADAGPSQRADADPGPVRPGRPPGRDGGGRGAARLPAI